MRIMEYHIISGKVVETRRCYLPERDGTVKVRGQRRAGNSSEKKIKANERGAVYHLARVLNTNFGVKGFCFATLKYDKKHVPQSYEELKVNAGKFQRKLRGACKKAGVPFEYVMVNANHNPKKDCPARLHHHLIVPIEVYPLLNELWQSGSIHVERVNNPGDLYHLAEYLCGNVHGLEAGDKRWTTSKGLDKPIYTEPKPVEDLDCIAALPDSVITDAHMVVDEDGMTQSNYMRQLMKDRVKVRGSMIILPRKKKSRMPVTMDMAIYQEDD